MYILYVFHPIPFESNDQDNNNIRGESIWPGDIFHPADRKKKKKKHVQNFYPNRYIQLFHLLCVFDESQMLFLAANIGA